MKKRKKNQSVGVALIFFPHRSFLFLLPFFLTPNRAESMPSAIPASSGSHSPISPTGFPTTASSTSAAHHQDGPSSPPV